MFRLMEEHAVWRCHGRERLLDRMGGLYGGVVFHVIFFYMAGRRRGVQKGDTKELWPSSSTT